MPDLSVDFVGIHFPNPYMLASAPPTRTAEMIRRAFAAGWGGAVTKTIAPEPVNNLQPRLQPLHHSRRKIGMENIELTTQLTLQDWQREIADIKAAYPDRPLWSVLQAVSQWCLGSDDQDVETINGTLWEFLGQGDNESNTCCSIYR